MADPTVLGVVLAGLAGLVGLVIRLQREQRAQVAAALKPLREALAAFAAPPPPPPAQPQIEVRLLASLEALDRRMAGLEAALVREVDSRERVERDLAKIVVAVARLETNVRWLRGSLAEPGASEAPES